ncbi:glycoside hydrolase family protein [Cyclobacterium marinum]|uniref:glycoside hydrolase family protein n=1 Tax=Cyclobacterium marinum TaxID=104 RepID=UPI0011EFED2E|nr:glycoside hydrolase family protein [Cyclobacterium marinum]MBI0397647.1 glycoside hydrolase family protein [Cyclobacterium marinum]
MRISLFVLFFIGNFLQGYTQEEDFLLLKGKFEPITEDNLYKDHQFYNWGGSIIKGEDGLYHLFYSRWQMDFSAWLTFSEIAHATSSSSNGPWEYRETVLKGRGKGYWDAITAHNPKIKYFDGKYYLYYIATNLGEMEYSDNDLIATHGKSLDQSLIRKTLRENQRTGVAVSSSLDGPWERLDQPIIQPSGPITTLTVNPAIAKGKDNHFYLIVKGDKPDEERFIRNQAIAISDSPVGPFQMQPNPVIDYQDTEDMSLYYDSENQKFYGVFHAHEYIGLVYSNDGINWKKPSNFKVFNKEIPLANGDLIRPDRMERPFVYFENNQPKTLCLAVKKGEQSYTVFIPIAFD